MNVLLLFAHPVESSFGAAVHARVRDALIGAGHAVDNCDLYAEGFDPVMSREERLLYQSVPANRFNVEGYCARLEVAEALVIVAPIWNYGFPAILKGYFDRVWLPGVSFDALNGRLVSRLQRIHWLAAVTTYGSTALQAFLAGDPPRRFVKRILASQLAPLRHVAYLALHDIDRSSAEARTRFLDKVTERMTRF